MSDVLALFLLTLVTSLDFNDGHLTATRRKRATSQEVDTQPVGSISFALTTDTIANCDRGLTNAGVYAILEYRLVTMRNHSEDNNTNDSISHSAWHHLGVVSIPASGSSLCLHEFSFNFSYVDQVCALVSVQFRLVQWEHGGGYCNCWGLVPSSLQVKTEENITLLELE